ncbi:uracil-xanthine permease [Chytriomyces sp. MP71]|nr:uracil-xanthine permease [Chytriomyces sp. MP71]
MNGQQPSSTTLATDDGFRVADSAQVLVVAGPSAHDGAKPHRQRELQGSYFPRYEYVSGSVHLDIEERPSIGYALVLGLQHLLAMFGATVLIPTLMGFDVSTTLFFSGLGTLLFYAITGGRVPAYLGASAAFLSSVATATGYKPAFFGQLNPNVAVAQGGIFVVGAVYALVGGLVHFFGSNYLQILMPPLVSGSVVMAIGLNLAGIGVNDATASPDAAWQTCMTILIIGAFAAFGPGFSKQIPILFGLVLSYAIAAIVGSRNGRPLDMTGLNQSPWVAAPKFTAPVFESSAIATILPAVIVLLAENMGHVATIGSITNRNLNGFLGRAFLGDALATMLSSLGGGAGVTTYAENIGTLAVTRVYSTIIFPIAAIFSLILSFIPKFTALLNTIPTGVWGGVEIVLFGLISITGARIWMQNNVDLGEPKNLFVAAVTVILGAGMPQVPGGVVHLSSGFQLDGIGLSAITALVLNLALFVIPDTIQYAVGKRKTA